MSTSAVDFKRSRLLTLHIEHLQSSSRLCAWLSRGDGDFLAYATAELQDVRLRPDGIWMAHAFFHLSRQEQLQLCELLADIPMRDTGAGAPGGATVSEGDDSNMAERSAACMRHGDATSGPEATSSQGDLSTAEAPCVSGSTTGHRHNPDIRKDTVRQACDTPYDASVSHHAQELRR